MLNYLNFGLGGTPGVENNPEKSISSAFNLYNFAQNYNSALTRYSTDFFVPFMHSLFYFNSAEQKRMFSSSPAEWSRSLTDILLMNAQVFTRAVTGNLQAVGNYGQMELGSVLQAIFNTMFQMDGEDLKGYIERTAKTLDMVANVYPQAILDAEPKYGFHFERGINPLVAETERFLLYQVMPTDPKVKVRKKGKPVMIIPPYVLGANILAFQPESNKSYAHSFANKGIPTYIRIMKNIHENEAVQVMTAEDDVIDTKMFCSTIKKIHGKQVTLNGYCQGGFCALCNILTGKLDGLVDALITCVSPMDGTRSKGLAKFLNDLPGRYNDLDYGTKLLPSGNYVADGKLMGWVYKLKSIEAESPISVFYRDLMMFGVQKSKKMKISPSAAAINYWLSFERTDLPLSITDMSFNSYNVPITKGGTLPVEIFGKKLNLKRINEKNIKWLICYGEHDDLVEKEAALAPMDFIDVEVTAFPKGHVAIATSWSNPDTEYGLHKRYADGSRGPVRFQLEIDNEQ